MTVVLKSELPLIVPDKVRRRAGFKAGDHVEFKASRGMLTILTKHFVPPDDTLTPEEAKKVRHALKQVRARKTAPWSRVKNELGL